jgi:hypothetical protein
MPLFFTLRVAWGEPDAVYSGISYFYGCFYNPFYTDKVLIRQLLVEAMPVSIRYCAALLCSIAQPHGTVWSCS